VITLNLVLMIFAVICLALAAIGVPTTKVSLGWLGLAFWALAVTLSGMK
jgi:hypothetical protein